ncbi:D-lactate ferricytochrome c oxidoreductase [Fusarium falciforme]|nr:D-lactate ferricytochrome c oxidoreductase [Fusarium falciforme]
MVGVPGKYKGCETCRRRRVKCSNERPYCQKCISSGRQCEGYERERVFITGTPENKGRVASHPKKGSSSKKPKASAGESSSRLNLTPLPPLASAWDDHTLVSNQGVEYSVLISALHTGPPTVLRDSSGQYDSAGFHIMFPPYTPLELQQSLSQRDFHVRAQCLARLPGVDELDDSAESYCIFFFEVGSLLPSARPDLNLLTRASTTHHTHLASLDHIRCGIWVQLTSAISPTTTTLFECIDPWLLVSLS